MGFLTDVLPSRNKSPPQDVPKVNIEESTEVPASTPSGGPVATNSASSANPSGDSPPAPPVPQADKPEASPIVEQSDKAKNPDASPSVNHRWSLQSPLGLLRKAKSSSPNSDAQDAGTPSSPKAADVNAKRSPVSSTDRRANESALVIRSLIVGQNSDGSTTPPVRASRTQLDSVKALLIKPKTANQVITQLKTLPALSDSASHTSAPIRAVCLRYTDAEAAEKHFSQLRNVEPTKKPAEGQTSPIPTITSATIESITEMIKGLHIVNLFKAPDWGLGQPGDGDGLLAGALPTAATVISGIEKVTPELMSVGYAIGKNMILDHAGVYPPLDRMSVLTYWWGWELVLPPPSMAYLDHAESITNTLINILTALSALNEGVREIVPFVRYASQYIDAEWNSIKAQDHGKGVVCTATWIMPIAMVPRPWDFPDPPKGGEPSAKPAPSNVKNAPAPASTPTASGEKAAPTSSSSPPEAVSGSPPSPSPAADHKVPEVVNPVSSSA
ncbi:hypothetical protein EI94DRAFT_1561543 [Lactarius quietus]|nr:hypothetical protein EI94DRAFT_1561543 [Lactarius quietus]